MFHFAENIRAYPRARVPYGRPNQKPNLVPGRLARWQCDPTKHNPTNPASSPSELAQNHKPDMLQHFCKLNHKELCRLCRLPTRWSEALNLLAILLRPTFPRHCCNCNLQWRCEIPTHRIAQLSRVQYARIKMKTQRCHKLILDTVSPIDVPGEATPARLSEPITRQVVPR